LDELVYAYAALNRVYQIKDRRTLWDQMEKSPEERKPSKTGKGNRVQKSFINQW